MQGSDDPTGERRAAGGDPTGETRSAALATAAVVAGVALVAAGILAVATEWRGVPGRPAALVRLFTPPPVRIGVPVAALGAAHGGASRLSPVPVSPTCRQRRTAVAGALVAGVGAVTGEVPVLGGFFNFGRPPVSLVASPLAVGWTLMAAGLGGAAVPDPGPVRSRAAGVATRAYARVAGATADPFPVAFRGGLLVTGALVAVGGGHVFASSIETGFTGGGSPSFSMAAIAGVYLLALGGGLAAVGAVLPGWSRLQSPPPARVLVLGGAGVLTALPAALPALLALGTSGGGVFHLGTSLVAAGLCWWAGAGLAARL